MADKFHSDTQEKIETTTYAPGLKDSGDLEASTKTVTATSEASGLGNADYSKALTLTAPSDVRLVVKRIAARLSVTIDSFDTATHLYCRVYVAYQDADHKLFDEDWDSIGAKLDAVDTHSAALSTIFDLLKDGAEHTFYFFFWVDQANNAVVSVCQLWETVGSSYTNYDKRTILQLDHQGFANIALYLMRIGTGTPSVVLWNQGGGYYDGFGAGSGYNTRYALPDALIDKPFVAMSGSVASDINYITQMRFTLRSEQ